MCVCQGIGVPEGVFQTLPMNRMTDTCKSITLSHLHYGQLLCRHMTAKIIIYVHVSVVCFVLSLGVLPTVGF